MSESSLSHNTIRDVSSLAESALLLCSVISNELISPET